MARGSDNLAEVLGRPELQDLAGFDPLEIHALELPTSVQYLELDGRREAVSPDVQKGRAQGHHHPVGGQRRRRVRRAEGRRELDAQVEALCVQEMVLALR